MQQINEIVEQLNQIEPEWTNYFLNSSKEPVNEQICSLLNQLIIALRQIRKDNPHDDIEEFEKILQSKEIYNSIMKFIDDSLQYYEALSIFRSIGKENELMATHLLLDIMENYIIRFDIEFSNRYEEYTFENQSDFEMTLDALESLTYLYVRRHYSKTMIEREFEDDSGISGKICSYYAQLVEEFYNDLRINLILDNSDAQKRIFSSIIERTKEKVDNTKN